MSNHPDVEQSGVPAAADDLREQLLGRLPMSERRVRLAGVSTAVLEGGQGSPMVLLHGPGEMGAVWLRVLGDLVATHRVIAPDLPGHGASHVEHGALDEEHVLSWLEELIADTCAAPPTLVGHLLGGSLALRFAVRHDPEVARLVLVDTYGLARLRPSPRFGLAMLGFIARPNERTQRRLFQQCFNDLDDLHARMGGAMGTLEAYALACAQAGGVRAALRRLMPAIGMAAIPPADLERITTPTTLIWGRDDRQVALRVAEAASARHGWPLHVIDDAGDDPAIERPEAFLRALRTALGD